MISPPWISKRQLIESVKPHFGGGTSSNPIVPPEFAPLINASVGNMVAQQGYNPISGYNAPNPMDVQGLTPAQQMGMGFTAGTMMNSPLDYMAAQAAQRAAGMSGAGPTTGSYDPTGEMGLQDWAQLLNPYVGQGGEMGSQEAPRNALADAENANVAPVGGQGTNYQGGPPNMSQAPAGSPAYSAAQGGYPPGGAGSTANGLPSGSRFYQDPSGGWRMAAPSEAGRIQGTGVHGMGAVDPSGVLNQYYFAASQGQAQPGQQLGAGTMSTRPTDPTQAAIWDRIQRMHPGAAVGQQAANTPQTMSMQEAMANPQAANFINHLQNRGAEGAAYQAHQGWAEAAARAQAARNAAPRRNNTTTGSQPATADRGTLQA